MVWEVLRLNVSFVCVWGRTNVSVGRAGIDPLTVWYIFRRLLAELTEVGLNCRLPVVLTQDGGDAGPHRRVGT